MASTPHHARLQALSDSVRDHLKFGIIPFWLARAPDKVHGGFLTNFDEHGHELEIPEKYLNTQCRLIWWFSHLNRHFPSQTHHALARQGVDFLLTHFWDATHGGWFWKTARDGTVIDDGKVSYGQSFAIYALSEYTLSTGDMRGLDSAKVTFDLMQKFAADTLRGGYYENLERDWSVSAVGLHAGDRKGLDTHMHLMEAFTALYETSRQEIHRRKLLEIVDLITQRMIDSQYGCGLNQFDLAWQSIPAIAIRRTWNAERVGDAPAQPTQTTSYGHNIELAWLMRRALEIAGGDVDLRRPMLRCLLDHAVRHGVDWEQGGIFRDGLRNGGPLVLEKEFWQHAEALVGFLDGYELFDDVRYLDAFENIWRFVQSHFIVEGVGEWRTLLERSGNPIDPKIGNPWKVAYHTGRAMVECNARLAHLMERKLD